ncbi:hypothetical protein BaRGS_00030477, partial [Batillaria attramentaria]
MQTWHRINAVTLPIAYNFAHTFHGVDQSLECLESSFKINLTTKRKVTLTAKVRKFTMSIYTDATANDSSSRRALNNKFDACSGHV